MASLTCTTTSFAQTRPSATQWQSAKCMTSLRVDVPRVAYVARHVQLLNLVMGLQRSIHHEVANHCRKHHSRLCREMANVNPGRWLGRKAQKGERTNLDITSSRSDLGISTRRRKIGEGRWRGLLCDARATARGWRPSAIVKRPSCAWARGYGTERKQSRTWKIQNSFKLFVYVS